jgi:hypothetical protein
MMRRLLPVFLSMTLFGPLLAAAGAEDRPAARSEGPALKDQIPIAKSNDTKSNDTRSNNGKIPVTRSDGSTGHTRPPDPKEIKKLVSYMRDGMNRADRSEKQRQTKRVIQNRRIWIRK